jgi:hypothetical protein
LVIFFARTFLLPFIQSLSRHYSHVPVQLVFTFSLLLWLSWVTRSSCSK